jgi:hypothetical protein
MSQLLSNTIAEIKSSDNFNDALYKFQLFVHWYTGQFGGKPYQEEVYHNPITGAIFTPLLIAPDGNASPVLDIMSAVKGREFSRIWAFEPERFRIFKGSNNGFGEGGAELAKLLYLLAATRGVIPGITILQGGTTRPVCRHTSFYGPTGAIEYNPVLPNTLLSSADIGYTATLFPGDYIVRRWVSGDQRSLVYIDINEREAVLAEAMSGWVFDIEWFCGMGNVISEVNKRVTQLHTPFAVGEKAGICLSGHSLNALSAPHKEFLMYIYEIEKNHSDQQDVLRYRGDASSNGYYHTPNEHVKAIDYFIEYAPSQVKDSVDSIRNVSSLRSAVSAWLK